MTKTQLPAEIYATRLLTRWYFLKRRAKGLPKGVSRAAFQICRHWGWDDNILGLATAWKTVEGRRVADQLAVTFYVRRKWSKRNLALEHRIPERLIIPGYPIDVVTDVVPLARLPVAHAGFPRVRPVQPGLEVGHLLGAPGTLCCVVTRQGETDRFGLACSHVLAREGSARAGDEIEQPSSSLSDPIEDRIGKLTEHFTRLRFNGDTNTSDHALVRLSVDSAPLIHPGTPAPLAVSQVRPEDLVRRRVRLNGSRTTGPECRVLGVEAAIGVEFRRGIATMAGLVAYETPCAAGDSGGAVIDAGNGELIGMHIAGVAGERKGFFLPVKKVFDDLNLQLVTS